MVFSLTCLNVEMKDDAPTFSLVFFELPLVHLPLTFYICNGWIGGKGSFYQEIRILKPDRTLKVRTDPQRFILEDENTPQFIFNLFEGIHFHQEGTYWVQTYLNDELVTEYPLRVRRV